jgi:hypothetical protein
MSGAVVQRTLRSVILKWSERLLLSLLALGAIGYLGDWAVFSLRGKPMDTVSVNRFLSVPLKGNKTEFDYEGTQPVPCAESLFPQNGSSPCWYLKRHNLENDKI